MKTKNKAIKRKLFRQLDSLSFDIGKNCIKALEISKGCEKYIKNNIKSDFRVGLEMLRVAMFSATENLEANISFSGKKGFEKELKGLREALDKAQESALTLDSNWGKLSNDDLVVSKEPCQDVDAWWQNIQTTEEVTPLASRVLRCYKNTQKSMQRAQQLLKPWVIRHLKPKHLPEPYLDRRRRRRLCGESICLNCNEDNHNGIS